MTPLRPRLAALALAGLASLAVAACSDGGSGAAATVGNRTITHDEVVEELEAIRANDAYVQAVEGTGQAVLGSSEDTFDADFVATQLGLRINYALVSNEVDRRGLEPTDTCREAARASLVGNLAAQARGQADGEALLDAFPEGYRDDLLDRETDLLLLEGDLIGQPCLSEDVIAAHFSEHRDDFEQACVSHILVDTADEADEIVDLLRGGADFATLAAERSVDVQSGQQGGDLGCLVRGTTVPAFEEAAFSQPVGVVGEPVETQFGFHVIRVDSRRSPELDEVRNEVAQAVFAEVRPAFVAWYDEALAGTDVDVDPRYGTWDAATSQVVRNPAGSGAENSRAAEPPAGE